MDDSFCRIPWQGIDISMQRNFKPCCKYNDQITIADTFIDYESSHELASLKEEFIAGGRPVKCARCWDDENAGIKSKRQIDFDNHLSKYPFDSSYKIISIPFGNTCNLACRTCKSLASSKWGPIEANLQKTHPSIVIRPHATYYKDVEFMRDMKQLAERAALIEIPGGEPFVTGLDEHKDFLAHMLKFSPGEKSLHYTTNCTIFPDQEFWDLWKHFKNVDLQLSLDGIGDRFEYMRWPAQWDKVTANVKRYQENQALLTNIQLSISHTVSILNVYYVDEFLQWCVDNQLPTPYIGMVSMPAHYNICNLPANVKAKVLEKLLSSKFAEVTPIRQYLMHPATHHDIVDEFALWTRELDEMRNQSFATTMPEMYALLLSVD